MWDISFLYNKALRFYIYVYKSVYVFTIADQTAEPN